MGIAFLSQLRFEPLRNVLNVLVGNRRQRGFENRALRSDSSSALA